MLFTLKGNFNIFKKIEILPFFIKKHNTDSKFREAVKNKGYISISYKNTKDNNLLVFCKTSEKDFEGWESITYEFEDRMKDWFKKDSKCFQLINANETITIRRKAVSALEEIGNHELKGSKRAKDTVFYRDLNLVTKTDLLNMPLSLIKEYKKFGFSSVGYREKFYIYIHQKDIKFVNKNLSKIIRDPKVSELIKINKLKEET